ncbi:hypothetical protein L2D08_18290 [Domibacillus sp. PGB-M46]|uniref:hypothetical protein n=1 Tax=Domibacillus sp. PGB-M46 TaxID=2910255 RepID=UPI001F5AEC65|nr:hypothetical protein [Domibacillus sp. PGB-M46]MCI2256296.1 hypothetical protein [Domibacillus sp. PGB-M46]
MNKRFVSKVIIYLNKTSGKIQTNKLKIYKNIINPVNVFFYFDQYMYILKKYLVLCNLKLFSFLYVNDAVGSKNKSRQGIKEKEADHKSCCSQLNV